MAVPCGDERDFKFAQYFQLPVTNIIGDYFNGSEANPTKDAILQNSDFLDGLYGCQVLFVAHADVVKANLQLQQRQRDLSDARLAVSPRHLRPTPRIHFWWAMMDSNHQPTD